MEESVNPNKIFFFDTTPRDRKSTRLNQSHSDLVCRLLLEKKKKTHKKKKTKTTQNKTKNITQ